MTSELVEPTSIEDQGETPLELLEAPERPLTPDHRARFKPLEGQPIQLGADTWLLAFGGLRESLRETRDALFDDWIYAGTVVIWEARAAAFRLLRMNYDLSEAEAVGLLISADTKELANAVVRAAIPFKIDRRKFSDWAEGALWSNGINPDDVPPRTLPHVLAQLVATGRAVPVDEYTDAGLGAAKRSVLLGMAQAQAAGAL